MTTRPDPTVLAKIRKAAARAVRDGAEFLLEDANRTAPIEEGTLIRSGQVSVDGLTASVSYDTPYAARQHEDTRLRHDEGRRAKWLELTAAENRDRIGEHLARTMREAS